MNAFISDNWKTDRSAVVLRIMLTKFKRAQFQPTFRSNSCEGR
jgi:hypothetical protein